jgi:hypothetical protein
LAQFWEGTNSSSDFTDAFPVPWLPAKLCEGY